MSNVWYVLAYLTHHKAQHKLCTPPPPIYTTSHRYISHFNSEMWCIYVFTHIFNLPNDSLQIYGNMSHTTHKTLSNTVVSGDSFCSPTRIATGCLALKREWNRGHNNKREWQDLVLSHPAPWGQNSITSSWFLWTVMVQLWFWVPQSQHIHCVTLCQSQLYQTVSNTVTAISGNSRFKSLINKLGCNTHHQKSQIT
jgi:hypothetical protein